MSTTTMPAQHSSPPLHIEGYRDMIVDEAKRLNDRLLKYFKIVLWIMLLSGWCHHHLTYQGCLILLIYIEKNTDIIYHQKLMMTRRISMDDK
jgi:hypothetical protein